jgi:hypothetical protein
MWAPPTRSPWLRLVVDHFHPRGLEELFEDLSGPMGELASQDGRFEATAVFPVDAGVESEPLASRLLHLLGVFDAGPDGGQLLEQPVPDPASEDLIRHVAPPW